MTEAKADRFVLVVDDEPRGVELMRRTLRRLGHVEMAASGEEAWELAQRQRFDLVVTDQRMPGIDGVELLSRVAEVDDHVGRLLVTGYADLEVTVEAINRGRVHAYLHKPFQPDQLWATASSVLERVDLARENARLVDELGRTVAELSDARERLLASEKVATIGRMAAMVVHDLRGPLTVLRSAGSEIRRASEPSAAECSELGREVIDETDRIDRMCNELLDVARLSERTIELHPCPVSDVISSAIAAMVDDASRCGVEVRLALDESVEVPLDAEYFRRAILNLAYNAVEAMPEGGLLEIRTRVDGDRLGVSVVDTGVGVPEEIRDTLFEPFVSTGKSRGTGLGLAIVRVVMDRHEGEVTLAKSDGGGTRFDLWLPITPSGA